MVQWDRKYLPSSRSCDAGLTVAGVARGRIAPERFSAPHDPLVAALLQLLDGRYLMKLPDCSPDIFYPDHRGCVDGAVDAGEAPAVALVRELHEELMVTLIRPT